MTAAVYIDGLNLYYGVAKPLDCKWVDLQKFLEAHFPNDDIRRIYFFEAMVSGPHRAHQAAYMAALETLPKVQVVLGEMKNKKRRCGVASCTYSGDRTWPGHEEKHTDVSIAITMVDDTHRAAYEKLILVTADTDLKPAVAMARSVRPQQKITLCIPGLEKGRIWGSKEVGVLAGKATRLDAELFVKSQFLPNFVDPNGTTHSRPALWRTAPTTAVSDWRAKHPGQWLQALPAWCS